MVLSIDIQYIFDEHVFHIIVYRVSGKKLYPNLVIKISLIKSWINVCAQDCDTKEHSENLILSLDNVTILLQKKSVELKLF